MITERVDVERAARWIREGEVVAFPTETVYGLGAAVFNPAALAKIFALKNRPPDNPLIVHIAALAQVEEIATAIPPIFYSVARAFFPGPLTVILRRHPRVPAIVSGGLDSIAVRMPSDPIALALIAAVGEPVAAPSANLSGKPSPTQCEHVLEDFMGKIPAVIDRGKTRFGIESTVISLLSDPPVLFRPGSITKREIEEAIGISILETGETKQVLSPGMKYRHYCPATRLILCASEEELRAVIQQEKRPMVLTRHRHFCGEHFTLSASELYRLLRLADAEGYSAICVLCDEELLRDAALKNRLFRAAGCA
jgi:L-threonylcarbamoyladenylate synthase